MAAQISATMNKKPMRAATAGYGAEPLPNSTIVWMRRLAIVVGIMVWAAVCQQTAIAEARTIDNMKKGCAPYSTQASGKGNLQVFGRCRW